MRSLTLVSTMYYVFHPLIEQISQSTFYNKVLLFDRCLPSWLVDWSLLESRGKMYSPSAQVKEKDLKFLTPDLEEHDRQAAMFMALCVIVSRKLVPEIYGQSW